jgi:putative peptidoglycan lipid II flippase
MVVVIGAMAAIMIATASPVARVVILGAPGHVDPNVLVRALITFAFGLPGYALVALMTRSMYAQGNARTPATAAVGGWLVAVVTDVVLADLLPRTWTVAAVGIGNSLGVTVTGIWLLVAVARSAGSEVTEGLRRTTTALLVAGAVSALAGWLLAHPLVERGAIRNAGAAVVVSVVAAATYLLVAALIDRVTVMTLLRRLVPARFGAARG